MIFYCKIEKGKFSEFNHKTFHDEITKLEGKRVEVKITSKNIRSIAQNRWWWGCMQILHTHTGFSTEEMHEICKFMFLKKSIVNKETGELYDIIGSTAKLTKFEFSETIEKVIKWAAESLKCVLPYPEEQTEIEYTK